MHLHAVCDQLDQVGDRVVPDVATRLGKNKYVLLRAFVQVALPLTLAISVTYA